MCAGVSELRPEALIVGDRDDVREDSFHLAGGRRHLQGLSLGQRVAVPVDQLLSPTERERARAYVQLWQESCPTMRCSFPNFVCHLGDEPRGGWRTVTSKDNALPTMRRAGGIYYSPWAGRQVLLRELYAAHGFPTFADLAIAAQVPIYRVFKPGLSYGHARAALGNSQVVPQVGVFTATALACLVRK